MFTPKSKQQAWLSACAFIILAYTTIFIGRPIQQFLSTQRIIMPLFFVAIIVSCFYILRQAFSKFQHWAQWLGLAGIIGFGVMIVRFFTGCPEELLHLLYYGPLGYFSYLALRFSHSNKTAMLLAFLFTGFFGWGDELIQHITPGRYFGWRDVQLNALSGIFGIMYARLFEKSE
jgi:hypothetical protein